MLIKEERIMGNKGKRSHPVSSGQIAKKQAQATADKLAAEANKGNKTNLKKMEALQAEARQQAIFLNKSKLAKEGKDKVVGALGAANELAAKNPLKVAAKLAQAVAAFQAGKKKTTPVVKADDVVVSVVKTSDVVAPVVNADDVVAPVVKTSDVVAPVVNADDVVAPVVKADDVVDSSNETLTEPPAVLIFEENGVHHSSVNVDATVQLNDSVSSDDNAPVYGPKIITPIVAALQKELNRLEAKATNAHGIEGFFWKSTYQAKADTIRQVISGAELSDERIIAAMDNSSSDLYKALNTHSSYVFQFSTNSYGLPVSTETRAVLNMRDVIEANKPENGPSQVDEASPSM